MTEGRGYDAELLPREQVVAAWRDEGFTASFEVGAGGTITSRGSGVTARPEDVRVAHQHRYEGITNPGDEELLLAIDVGGERGTLTLTYGSYASADEAEVLRRLPRTEDEPGAARAG